AVALQCTLDLRRRCGGRLGLRFGQLGGGLLFFDDRLGRFFFSGHFRSRRDFGLVLYHLLFDEGFGRQIGAGLDDLAVETAEALHELGETRILPRFVIIWGFVLRPPLP